MKQRGFSIIELITVIIIIGILATITAFTHSEMVMRAREVNQQSDIDLVQDIVEIYYIKHGKYPKTTDNPESNWRAIDVRTDDNCTNGSSQADWVPDVGGTLPQSTYTDGYGVGGLRGCYLYASNGENYVISAWNMLAKPQTSVLYRRLGFREFQTDTSTQFYTCNSNTVGGASGGYNSAKDYYKHSYTVSDITDCNETPPPGA